MTFRAKADGKLMMIVYDPYQDRDLEDNAEKIAKFFNKKKSRIVFRAIRNAITRIDGLWRWKEYRILNGEINALKKD